MYGVVSGALEFHMVDTGVALKIFRHGLLEYTALVNGTTSDLSVARPNLKVLFVIYHMKMGYVIFFLNTS